MQIIIIGVHFDTFKEFRRQTREQLCLDSKLADFRHLDNQKEHSCHTNKRY